MNRWIRRAMVRDERKLARRLDAAKGGQKRRSHGPELAGNPRLEMAERTRAMPYGGVGTMLELARDVGLMAKLDSELGVLERPHPYTDADHVMNIALNILCGGRVLDDIEARRNDRVFLDALGARANPDPTTAGDDCRRFETEDVLQRMLIVNDVRVGMWRRQGSGFFSKTAHLSTGHRALLNTSHKNTVHKIGLNQPCSRCPPHHGVSR